MEQPPLPLPRRPTRLHPRFALFQPRSELVPFCFRCTQTMLGSADRVGVLTSNRLCRALAPDLCRQRKSHRLFLPSFCRPFKWITLQLALKGSLDGRGKPSILHHGGLASTTRWGTACVVRAESGVVREPHLDAPLTLLLSRGPLLPVRYPAPPWWYPCSAARLLPGAAKNAVPPLRRKSKLPQ